MASERDYLVLSALGYADFIQTDIGKSINSIDFSNIEHTTNNNYSSETWQSDVSQMGDWTLIDFVNNNGGNGTGSGFCGVAFKNLITGEIVFSFRGTEPSTLEDLAADLQIAIAGTGSPSQFTDARNFVANTLVSVENNGYSFDYVNTNLSSFVSENNVSFTGHSLGGGIDEYLTYLTGGRTVSFNGVGIGQLLGLDSVAASMYNALNICLSTDMVGHYGIHLGETRDLLGNSWNTNISRAQLDIVSKTIKLYESSVIPNGMVTGLLELEFVLMSQATRDYVLNTLQMKDHGIDLFKDFVIGDSIVKDLSSENHASWLSDSLSDVASNVLGSSNPQSVANDLEVLLGAASAATLDTLQSGFNEISNALNEVLSNLGQEANSGFESIVEFANNIEQQVQDGLDSISGWINNLINSTSSGNFFGPGRLFGPSGLFDGSGQFGGGSSGGAGSGRSWGEPGNLIPSSPFGRSGGDNGDNENWGPFGDAPTFDPLVLDLNGDGIATISILDGVVFDVKANGFAQYTGWVSANDGLLVIDGNDNGLIDNGQELFGDQRMLSDGTRTLNGFQALAALDANGDGKVNVSDMDWSKIHIWQDLNENGISESGELFTLDQLGVASLNLTNTATNIVDLAGNTQMMLGSFERQDGSIGQMADYLFRTDNINTTPTSLLDVPSNIQELPYLPGHGTVYDSWQAMVRDESGSLQGLIQSYSEEDDPFVRSEILDQIIYKWTGSDNVDPQSRGQYMDARQLVALENLFGEGFVGRHSPNPNRFNVFILNNVYNKVKDYYEGWLMAQTRLKSLFSNLGYSYDANGQTIVDISIVQQIIEGDIAIDYQQGKTELSDFVKAAWATGLAATFSNDFGHFVDQFISESQDLALVIYSTGRPILDGVGLSNNSTGLDAILFGGDGGDNIYSGNNNDVLFGEAGNDNLFAGSGNDVLDGGVGNDTLFGNTGSETYIWRRGSGNDVIYNVHLGSSKVNPGHDRILLGNGITVDSLNWLRDGNNLILELKDTRETLTVMNWFIREDYKIGTIKFTDGTEITAAQAGSKVMERDVHGLNWLQAGDEGSTLDGGAANVTYFGGQGNDTYLWGAESGNDIIYNAVSSFNDVTYISPGNDTIQLSEGITADSIDWIQDGNDVILRLKDSGKTLTIKNWFHRDDYKVSTIRFTDGSEITAAQVSSMVIMKDIHGFGYLQADNDGSTMDGEARNEIFYGGQGNDTYLWGSGSGNNTIYNAVSQKNETNYVNQGEDTIQLSAGITVDSLDWIRNGNDVILKLKSSGKTLTIKDWFYRDDYKVSKIRFADGSEIMAAQVSDMVVMKDVFGVGFIRATDDGCILDGETANEGLFGGGGNDIYLWGVESGNHIIYGQINGGNGQDTVRFGAGLTIDLLELEVKNYNLIIRNKTTGKTLTISNWFSNANYQVQTFQFADGTSYTRQEIDDRAVTYGTANGDSIFAIDGRNNTIYGLDGNDSLFAGNGNDVLDGGLGNDLLFGGTGNDTFIWSQGWGNDKIDAGCAGAHGQDTVKFGVGLTIDSLEYQVSGRALVMRNKTTGETLTLSNWFTGVNYQVQTFEFADGTSYTGQEIADRAVTYGTANGDSIFAIDGRNNTIYGLDGNDSLFAGNGNDVLDGGSGNDFLYGGTGNDTFIWGQGWGNDKIDAGIAGAHGQDTVRLGVGLTVDIMEYRISGDDLVMQNKTTGETLTLSTWFAGVNYQVQTFEFADGTSYTGQEIADRAVTYGTANGDSIFAIDDRNNTIYGLDGNDLLFAGSGNDVLDGGLGNDLLYGGTGNDTFIWGQGWGNDKIDAGCAGAHGQDTVRLGVGLTIDSLEYQVSGSDLVMQNKTTGETLTLSNWFTGVNYQVQTFEFANGTSYTGQEIADMAVTYGTTGTDYKYAINDRNNTIYGLDGDDYLYAGNGNDVLDGGSGNDILYGGTGNDTFIWGQGWGNDKINAGLAGAHGQDTVKLGVGLTIDSFDYQVSGSNLVMKNKTTGETLTLLKWFTNANYQIQTFQFVDGISYIGQEIADRAITYGTADADNIYGFSGRNNTVYGLAGNDNIFAGNGNDFLDGGAGNDFLYGGIGNDTFIWGQGWGNDKINAGFAGAHGQDILQFQNLALAAIQFSRSNNDLVCTFNQTGETVTIAKWYLGENYQINQFQFTDGMLTVAEVNLRVQ